MNKAKRRSDMDTAYAAVIDDAGAHRLAICIRNETGYYPCIEDSDAGGTFESFEAAMECADLFNKRLGLTTADAARIVGSTFGRVTR